MTEYIIHVTPAGPDGAPRPVGRVVCRPGGKAACDATVEPGLDHDTVRFTLAGMLDTVREAG